MTTTVIVKARAHGAIVTLAEKLGEDTTNHTEFKISPNTDRKFDISDNHSITVVQDEPPVPTTAEEAEEQHAPNPRPFIGEPVPGAAEDDALLGDDPIFVEDNEEDDEA